MRNLDLSLTQGEIACILGESGSGKTTLLRIIAGFEKIDNGTITLNGKILSDKNSSITPDRRKVGMIFQDFALFPHLNVFKNIEFGIRQSGIDDRKTICQRMINMVGLGGLENAMPHQLSGGQQQRVAVARSLVVEPDLLLLDEPFSNIDIRLKQQLLREIRSLLIEKGVTAILVTHDHREAFAFADKLALINKGRCIEVGTPKELYLNPKNKFTAEFFGEGKIVDYTGKNTGIPLLDSEANQVKNNSVAEILVRPGNITLSPGSGLKFPIVSKEFRGEQTIVELKLLDGQQVLCQISSQEELEIGALIEVSFDLKDAPRFSN